MEYGARVRQSPSRDRSPVLFVKFQMRAAAAACLLCGLSLAATSCAFRCPLSRPPPPCRRHRSHLLASEHSPSAAGQTNPVHDKLIDALTTPKDGNLTSAVEDLLDMCDNSFLEHLREKIVEAGPESEWGNQLTEVATSISAAMQRRLVRADSNLREILGLAPDIKAMEAGVRRLLRSGTLDMPFMVVLMMNLAQAQEAGEGAENAVKVLNHLNTFIMELQDAAVSAEVRLLRRLVRAEDAEERRVMLRDNLNLPGTGRGEDEDDKGVLPDDLRKALSELKEQASQIGGSGLNLEDDMVTSLQDLEDMVNAVESKAYSSPSDKRGCS
jgi:hypothetical protein